MPNLTQLSQRDGCTIVELRRKGFDFERRQAASPPLCSCVIMEYQPRSTDRCLIPQERKCTVESQLEKTRRELQRSQSQQAALEAELVRLKGFSRNITTTHEELIQQCQCTQTVSSLTKHLMMLSPLSLATVPCMHCLHYHPKLLLTVGHIPPGHVL